jgi:OPA family sugar phosphate sensor protein UhpC-like MFS transporter
MSIFDLFKPAPHEKKIEDPALIDSEYKYWRMRIFYSMFIGYAFYYFTRKSFTFAMPALMVDLGIDKSQLGILGSILYITYGISKFTSGIFADRSNPRYFMAIGLILTGVFNICFGLSSSLYLFALFWGLNGWFQGFGWPPCARLLTHWYSRSERGRWWSFWNVSHNVGGFVVPLVVAFATQYYGWRYGMYIPGALCILVGFFLINRLRDTPQSLGLPPIEKYRNDEEGATALETAEQELTSKQILLDYILKNRAIWLLAAAYFFVYVIRTGVNDWSAFYLIETKGYSQIGANACVSLFDVGGFFGCLLAGWASDKVFSGMRGPVNILFALGTLGAIAFLWMTPGGSQQIDSIAMFLLGSFIFGPQMLIGVAAAELSHKKAAATATGFVGCFAYIGAAASGYPLGKIAQDYGWEGYFWALSICAASATLLLLPLWQDRKKTVQLPSEA